MRFAVLRSTVVITGLFSFFVGTFTWAQDEEAIKDLIVSSIEEIRDFSVKYEMTQHTNGVLAFDHTNNFFYAKDLRYVHREKREIAKGQKTGVVFEQHISKIDGLFSTLNIRPGSLRSHGTTGLDPVDTSEKIEVHFNPLDLLGSPRANLGIRDSLSIGHLKATFNEEDGSGQITAVSWRNGVQFEIEFDSDYRIKTIRQGSYPKNLTESERNEMGENLYALHRPTEITTITEYTDVNGIPFPIKGNQRVYLYDWEKIYKYDEDYETGKIDRKEYFEKVYRSAPLEYTIDKTLTVTEIPKINVGLERSDFVIQYPKGTSVWDYQMDSGFIVGNNIDKTIGQLTDDLVDEFSSLGNDNEIDMNNEEAPLPIQAIAERPIFSKEGKSPLFTENHILVVVGILALALIVAFLIRKKSDG